MFTVSEKLQVVEQLVEDFRWTRDELDEAAPERRTYTVLKAIARDLRARLDGTPSQAEVEIGRRVSAVRASKTHLGYDQRRMIALAEEILHRWPAVRQGLELLGKEEAAS